MKKRAWRRMNRKVTAKMSRHADEVATKGQRMCTSLRARGTQEKMPRSWARGVCDQMHRNGLRRKRKGLKLKGYEWRGVGATRSGREGQGFKEHLPRVSKLFMAKQLPEKHDARPNLFLFLLRRLCRACVDLHFCRSLHLTKKSHA